MQRLLFFLVSFLTFISSASAQQVDEMTRPKLVVGIMVDQMRWDYLTRYYDRYGDGGFRRLMHDGYNSNRMMINYLPAVTAVGHTSVYTGSVPAYTGIIGNSFPVNGKYGTSVHDDSVRSVGTTTKSGMSSPRRLLVTTITDELRLATNFRAKTIGIALKDRASILPAGHCANAAYWFDLKTLDFITSTYYMKELPQWVKDFNKAGNARKYLDIIKHRKNKSDYWDLLYDSTTYVQSTPNKHEYYFDKIYSDPEKPELNMTPWGNTITADMAIAAIDGEQLGHNPAGVPDFLAISFSSTDMIGHQVAPNAIWQEDVFLRLDKDIARLLSHLDDKVGKDDYVVFLSADHAGAHNSAFLQDHKIPAGNFEYTPVKNELNDSLKSHFAVSGKMVKSIDNLMVYLDNDYLMQLAKQRGIDADIFKEKVMTYISQVAELKKSIAYCFPFRCIPSYIPEPVRTMAQNGYCPGRSGDMQIISASQYVEDWDAGVKKGYNGVNLGTTHAVWNPYDTHIPFIIMGSGIRHAWDYQTRHVTDITATLAAILNIQQPSACVGDAIDVMRH